MLKKVLQDENQEACVVPQFHFSLGKVESPSMVNSFNSYKNSTKHSVYAHRHGPLFPTQYLLGLL